MRTMRPNMIAPAIHLSIWCLVDTRLLLVFACTSVSFSVCWKEYQTIYSPSFCFFNHFDFIKFIKEQLKNILIFRFKLCEFIICKNTQKFTKHSVSTVIHVLVYTMHWGSAYVLCATSGTMLWTVCKCVCPPGYSGYYMYKYFYLYFYLYVYLKYTVCTSFTHQFSNVYRGV